MRLQIDFETKVIHILDDLDVVDFNMIAFTHKLGGFTFAGLLSEEDEELPEDTLELGPHTSVAEFYNNKEG